VLGEYLIERDQLRGGGGGGESEQVLYHAWPKPIYTAFVRNRVDGSILCSCGHPNFCAKLGALGMGCSFVASYFSSTDVSMSFFAAGDYDREMRDAMIQPNLLYDSNAPRIGLEF
jgi:hypothetical protein